ncbi:MAG: RagB/SusD family nutrient uptake outer membrane protein [Bacteroidales bacterium]|nr:RagB/SusD family nutrient uptake outer membrane protein [Bacteroidales bacterium]
MKKTLKYILSATLISFAVVSCNVLDTPSTSSFETSSVFSSYSLAERAIFGISEVFSENNSYYNRFVCYYGFNTDIEWGNSYDANSNKNRIGMYDVLPTNGELNTQSNNVYKNVFSFLYDGIERANLAIEGLTEYGDIDNDFQMRYLYAEALTLRAFIYYELIKTWGDVPARFHSVTPETIYLPKSNRDVIFKQILSDLEVAIPSLPYPAAGTRTDRINKVFAEGLYARIALAASGYALRPGPDGSDPTQYVNTGAEGSVRLSSDPELSKENLYPKALAFLADAINNGGCTLASDLTDYWKRFNLKQNTVFDGETLYIIPFSDTRGRWNYTYAMRSDESSYTNGVGRGGDVGPVPNFWFKFAENDLRRDITCVNWKWDKNDKPVIAGIAKWYFGKYRYDWMNPYYDGGNSDGVKPIVMRYADILLMAAEIENEVGTLDNAKKYLGQVRKRAFAGNESEVETYLNGITSKEAMFDAIVDERAFEFCGETLRKGDLIRWNMLTAKIDETKADLYRLRNLEAPYDYMTGNVYSKIADDGKSLIIYGFKPGETDEMDPFTWTVGKEYVTKTVSSSGQEQGLSDTRIEAFYVNDPDSHMFWPILQGTLDDSQGAIKNDYGY